MKMENRVKRRRILARIRSDYRNNVLRSERKTREVPPFPDVVIAPVNIEPAGCRVTYLLCQYEYAVEKKKGERMIESGREEDRDKNGRK